MPLLRWCAAIRYRASSVSMGRGSRKAATRRATEAATRTTTTQRRALFDVVSRASGVGHHKDLLEIPDAVAQGGGLLEAHLFGSGAHLRLQADDLGLDLLRPAARLRGRLLLQRDFQVVRLLHAAEHLVDRLDDGLGSDAVP